MLIPAMHTIPTASGLSVPALVLWTENSAVFDFQAQGSALAIQAVKSVWIDNSANPDNIVVTVAGSVFSFTVRGGISGTFPIFVRGLPRIEITCAGTGGRTTFVFVDYEIPFFSYASSEVGQTVTDTVLSEVLTVAGDDKNAALRVTLSGGGIPDPLPTTVGGTVAITSAAFDTWAGLNYPVTAKVASFDTWVQSGSNVSEKTISALVGNKLFLPTQDTVLSGLVGEEKYIPTQDTVLSGLVGTEKYVPTQDAVLSGLVGSEQFVPTSDVNLANALSNGAVKTVEGFRSSGLIGVSVSGADFSAAASRECNKVEIFNGTGTVIDLKLGASGDVVTIPSGCGLTFQGDLYTDNFMVRRTDQTDTAVSVALVWHST